MPGQGIQSENAAQTMAEYMYLPGGTDLFECTGEGRADLLPVQQGCAGLPVTVEVKGEYLMAGGQQTGK